ncbi:uncharacterized protein DUF742 [Saccharopolyspora erythraea NRRL 2338]|uniref:Uncharacterized protein n=2 Tax=Saccharopolyspora erythraea TaxID=1836 RepID=A4FN83_SACEN|nr:DUF742 domain-containing protein [Saccharopolyspora erythraea]EQD82204.1 hypothetical protein N599_31980 [Saccharopolyspora erythraea D]PFG99149.1 uncharacterized protein DUF742 [Saccharopolyspora erythraea NRRL 2338]QRK89103.1 DUF742 domain-containing protein [Saccharopolyspora erythraea]CAM05508.1 hypothetical protein SACE_6338 [Saccharopolyspora erythraea NRRL 2338]
MTTGSDSPGRRSSDADAMAEVFSRFTLDSGRGRRRHRAADEGTQPRGAVHSRVPAHSRGDAQHHVAAREFDQPANETPWPAEEPLEDEEAADAAEPPPHDQVEGGAESAAATYIRPYAWTGGRTRSNHRLELETLVSTSEMCRPAVLQRLEHHSIAGLCQHPRSVAEIGALLGVPLGVVRVLIGDMADLGLITVHRTVSENGSTSHLDLMERVLKGLRRL